MSNALKTSDICNRLVKVQYKWPEFDDEPKTLSVLVHNEMSIFNEVAKSIALECDWTEDAGAQDPAICLEARFRRGSRGGSYAYVGMLGAAEQAYNSISIALPVPYPKPSDEMLDIYDERAKELSAVESMHRTKRHKAMERAERCSEKAANWNTTPRDDDDECHSVPPISATDAKTAPSTNLCSTEPSYVPTSPSYSPTSPTYSKTSAP
jgi:hypothetical protein